MTKGLANPYSGGRRWDIFNTDEVDIIAHEDRIKDMNKQAKSLVDSGQFDSDDIREKRDSISSRSKVIQGTAAHRQALLNDAAVVAPEAGDRQALARPLLH